MPADFVKGFVVREPAWHRLAVVFDEYPGRDAAMEAAGHDFVIAERPVFVGLEDGPQWYGAHKALVNEETEDMLSVVNTSYTVIQNSTVWDTIDTLAESESVLYESGGILRGGSQLWVLAKVGEPSKILNDPSPLQCYLVGSWAHNGSASFKVGRTSVRVVCSNTHDAAMNEMSRTGFEYTFRHTANVADRIGQAKEALSGVRSSHQLFVELAEELVKETVSLEQTDAFIESFIPMPEETVATLSERVKANIDEARQAVRNLLGGETIPESIARTKWGLLQAGTEYLDHERPYRNDESYAGRSLRPQPRKKALLRLVRGL